MKIIKNGQWMIQKILLKTKKHKNGYAIRKSQTNREVRFEDFQPYKHARFFRRKFDYADIQKGWTFVTTSFILIYIIFVKISVLKSFVVNYLHHVFDLLPLQVAAL